MKYMLLIYNNPALIAAFPEEQRAAILEDVDVLMKELTESGELVGGEALADATNTRTVRVRGDEQMITDGPFVESKEQFAGFVMVECESEQRAIEIAARWPDARYFAMEVRPVMHTSGLEM